MSHPTQDSQPLLAAQPPVVERATLTPGIQAIDGTKLNTLIADLTSKLKSDVQGNFYIEGTRITRDTRHEALGLVFQTLKELQVVSGKLDQQAAMPSVESAAKAKRNEKSNNHTKTLVRTVIEEDIVAGEKGVLPAAIKATIEEVYSDHRRDLAVVSGRFEKQVEQMKQKHISQEKEIQALKAERKSQTALGTRWEHFMHHAEETDRGQTDKMTKLERKVKQAQGLKQSLAADVLRVEQNMELLQTQHEGLLENCNTNYLFLKHYEERLRRL